jgi:hypothetical protein
MKFLCIPCDEVMTFAERQLPGDGTMAAVFTCPRCTREIAMLANPMETQMVSGLGIRIGGRTVPAQPLELTLGTMDSVRSDALTSEREEGAGDRRGENAEGSHAEARRVVWSEAATGRLANVPSFVRGMVKRIYTDYATERGIDVITPAVMDRARSDLGLEGM